MAQAGVPVAQLTQMINSFCYHSFLVGLPKKEIAFVVVEHG